MYIYVFKSLYNIYLCYLKFCINFLYNYVILKFVYKDDILYLRYLKVYIKLI